MRMVAIVALLLGPAAMAAAVPRERVGTAYEIRVERTSAIREGDGSVANSTDRDMVVERLTAIRDDGVELSYARPAAIPAHERVADWQFPARVFRPDHGPVQLLNRPELERRRDRFLAAAGLTSADCGQIIFTWDLFRIECDPQLVLQSIDGYDFVPGELRDGAGYSDPAAAAPGQLRQSNGAGGTVRYVAQMPIDPQVIRRERALTAAFIAQLEGHGATANATPTAQPDEPISGTVAVTLDRDAAGLVWRRTRVISLTVGAAGKAQRETRTEVVERHLLSPSGDDRPNPGAPAHNPSGSSTGPTSSR